MWRFFPEWLVRIGGLLPLACIGLLGTPEAARCQGYGLTTVADLSTALPGALGPCGTGSFWRVEAISSDGVGCTGGCFMRTNRSEVRCPEPTIRAWVRGS